MNIQSIILLAVVIAVAAFVLYRYLRSDNKCSCCEGCNKDCCAKLLILLLFLPFDVLASVPYADARTGATELPDKSHKSDVQILAHSNDSTREGSPWLRSHVSRNCSLI